MSNNKLVITSDGSHTLFSNRYNQHFHNTEDGSLSEALNKHVIPAFTFHINKTELNILDICYGIGYNTLATIFYVITNKLNIKLNIYSPELDFDLIKSLNEFEYPPEFSSFKDIIYHLSQNQKFSSQNLNIEIFIGNARQYLKKLPTNFFDIIYQDAFSSDVNFELWTKEFFEDVYKISKRNSILTTYAISTNIRLSLSEAGFFIYELKPTKRKITLAFKQKQNLIGQYIDMELKKERNKNACALYDN